MAYSNWGAFVYKNDERQTEREDTIPYREEDGISGFPLVLLARDEHQMAHHAVLGTGTVRWCAHKSSPILYVNGEMVTDQELRKRYATNLEDVDGYLWETEETIYQGEIEGYKFRAKPFTGNMIDLELVEPDGTIYTARSGYCYGAGFDQYDEGNKTYGPFPWKD